MTDDFRDFSEFPKRRGWPNTSLGRWSLGLLAGFIALTGLFFALMQLYYGGINEVSRLSAKSGGGFFSLPLFAGTLVAAFVLAFAAGVAAIAAIKRKGEQSILMVLPLLMGGIAAMFAFGVLVELVVRASA